VISVKKILALSIWVFVATHGLATSGDYNRASLLAVKTLPEERFSVDLNEMSGDPSFELRLEGLLQRLQSDPSSEAKVQLTNELEHLARLQDFNALSLNEAQRRAAKALTDVVFEHKLGRSLPVTLKVEIVRLLDERFMLPEEHEILNSWLEIKRRKSIKEVPVSVDSELTEPQGAVEGFKNRLSEALLTPEGERDTLIKFWNATEETFNQLEKECGELSRCASDAEKVIGELGQTNEADSTTVNKLKAILALRLASDETLQDLNQRADIDLNAAPALAAVSSPKDLAKEAESLWQRAQEVWNNPQHLQVFVLIFAGFLAFALLQLRRARRETPDSDKI
jgi:hypothetical protein